ncbi:MAG: hypothetical protein BWY09_02986 [Candidatus Hydrogenedentes bacterium ADurb.Bin179]|nr:MAG: hypothetical protein BWY09_02986 [Candidatus Hydrogenedentes bacterium ADurb.Bin179]
MIHPVSNVGANTVLRDSEEQAVLPFLLGIQGVNLIVIIDTGAGHHQQ